MNNENIQKNTDITTDGTGYLVVRVSAASGAIPLDGARVTVRGGESANGDFFYGTKTGASGLTEKIALPAPRKYLSESPAPSERPYALYSIDVFKDGYNDSFFLNVPVFDTITSVQGVNMIPLADNKYPDSFAPYDEVVNEGGSYEL